MEIKSLFPLYVSNLVNNDVYSLAAATIDCSQSFKEILGELPNAILTQLESENIALGNELNKSFKSDLTERITQQDKRRDDCYSELKRTISNAIKSRNALYQNVAKSVKIFFDPYWNLNKMALNTQTSIVREMIEKFKADENMVSKATSVGINNLMIELEQLNESFDELYQQRLEQRAAQDSPSASSLKPTVVKNYEQFCMSIEQLVNFKNDESITSLFNQINELRRKYSRLDKNVNQDVTVDSASS